MSEARRTASADRRIAALVAAVIVVLCCGWIAQPASAGTYSVYSCSGPSGESLPNSAWMQKHSAGSLLSLFSLGGSCPSLTVTALGPFLNAGENAGFAFDAPDGTSITGYSVKRSISISFLSVGSKPALSAGLRRTVGGVDSYSGECEAVVSACSVATSITQATGISASSLQLGVQCSQGSGCGSLGLNVAKATLASARVDLSDNAPPTLSLSGGTLPGARAVSGTRDLDVSINDEGGGIKSYWITIDGVKRDVTNLGGSCSGIFKQRVPCPLSQDPTFSVDLAAVGAGFHTVVVYASDAAGNIGKLAPITFGYSGPVYTSNGTPSVTTPLVITRSKVIEGRGGKTVAIRGDLKTADGAPISGARLEVVAVSVGGNAAIKPLGITKTSSRGTFKFNVKPKGARQIVFEYHPSSTSETTASASTLVRQKLSLIVHRSKARLVRGQQLVISGKLSGTAGAAAGAPVEIAVRNGRKWQRVGLVAADKSGRFVWKHRFTKVTRPTLFTFRAVVRSNATWPWKTKTSGGVKVLVLG
ncbi:MAG: hypothetical protein QM648_12345 [Solirubrobacterales bacterium]